MWMMGVRNLLQGAKTVTPDIVLSLFEYYDALKPFHPFSQPPKPEFSETFGVALDLLKSGMSVARKGWTADGMRLSMQHPDANAKMTLPYIYLTWAPLSAAHPSGDRVPWQPSQADMFAQDWDAV